MAHHEPTGMAHLEPRQDEGKVPLIKSPIVKRTSNLSQHGPSRAPTGPDLTDLGFRDGPRSHDIPEFERHEEATNIEVKGCRDMQL